MGNNPSRAQHQHHNHHLLHPHGSTHGQSQGASSSTSPLQSSNGGVSNSESPQRSPAVVAARRGSLPHTPSPTSTKNYQGLYPIRVAQEQPSIPSGDHAFLDPRGLLPDLSGVRRGSTGGVDIGSRGGGIGAGRIPEHYGTVASDGIYGAGLPPQFKNPDPFRTGRPHKPPSFIAEEPLESTRMAGPGAEELQRRGSVRSTTTVEDDEVTIDESRSIPTLVTWTDGGNKVYITGTFCGWRKKYRLTKGPEDKILSAIVPLPAGTHHVKFLVDGELRTSDTLPTAVDSTGILVNYLEVNADDMLTAPLERQLSPDHTEALVPQNHQHVTASKEDTQCHPSPHQQPYPSTHQHDHPQTHSTLSADEQFQFIRPRPQRYTDTIPIYLRDFEENQERYVVTGSAMHGSDRRELPGGLVKISPPPTLPLMLGKVILNSSSHLKDDNSVLGIPNHVVLNHLATSSIKNHVLAVSATTRYRKKYVSTILYKATTE